MAKKIDGYIKLQIPAGAATPAPPVGLPEQQHLHHRLARLSDRRVLTSWTSASSSTQEHRTSRE